MGLTLFKEQDTHQEVECVYFGHNSGLYGLNEGILVMAW